MTCAQSCCSRAASIPRLTLAIARQEGFACHALSCVYGQRHGAELEAAARVAQQLGAVEHRVMSVDLAGIGGSALTDRRLAVPEQPSAGIPITYVPARNTMLLALAARLGGGPGGARHLHRV